MSGGSEVKAADAGGVSPRLHGAKRWKLGDTGGEAREGCLDEARGEAPYSGEKHGGRDA